MLYGDGQYRYELVDGWAKMPEGWSFLDIGGLSIDMEDRLYVLNRGARPVLRFDSDGNLLTHWGEGFFKNAHGTCIGPDGSVFCTDNDDHIVTKFTPDGNPLLTLGKRGQPADTGYIKPDIETVMRGGQPFNRPTGVALSSSGDIYVSDGYGNARIHKFSSGGSLLFSWGEPGKEAGQFKLPHSVRVDKQERVWVCDRENGRIQIFTPEGKFLEQWKDIGGKPTDLFFGNDNNVYVSLKSESQPHGISVFSFEGKLITRWGAQGENQKTDKDAMFVTPHAIAVDSHGDIYLGEIRHEMAKTDPGNRALRKFVRMR